MSTLEGTLEKIFSPKAKTALRVASANLACLARIFSHPSSLSNFKDSLKAQINETAGV